MSFVSLITPALLDEGLLRAHLYPDLDTTLYWTPDWSPRFYVKLARAGFLCIAFDHPELGPVLIPELQEAYAVLDWDRLRVPRSLRRGLRRGEAAEADLELRFAASPERVLAGIRAQHEKCWLLPAYGRLFSLLPGGEDPSFSLRIVELWSRRRREVVAGEIGYSIGRTYTSLSGFCLRDEPALRSAGTLQLVWLAERLRDAGYAFWNLGHTEQPYKAALGARPLERGPFLERWLAARGEEPKEPLSDPEA